MGPLQDREVAEFEDAVAIKETERALLCRIDGKEHWIPKSQIDDDSEVYQDGDEGKLVVSMWFAEKEGLPI